MNADAAPYVPSVERDELYDAEPEQERQLVAKTVEKSLEVYGGIKQAYVPDRLQFAFNTFESLLTTYVSNPYDPLSYVPEIDNQLNRVVSAVTGAVENSRETVNKTVEERVITPVTNVVDVVKQSAETRVQNFKSLKGDLSKKSTEVLNQKISQIRAYSANELKDIIHIDLIAYSSEVIDNASQAAKPAYDLVQEKLAVAIVRVNDSVESIKTLAQVVKHEAQTKLNREALQERLQDALARARARSIELSVAAREYIAQSPYVMDKAEWVVLNTKLVSQSLNLQGRYQNLRETVNPALERLTVLLVEANTLLKERIGVSLPLLPNGQQAVDAQGVEPEAPSAEVSL